CLLPCAPPRMLAYWPSWSASLATLRAVPPSRSRRTHTGVFALCQALRGGGHAARSEIGQAVTCVHRLLAGGAPQRHAAMTCVVSHDNGHIWVGGVARPVGGARRAGPQSHNASMVLDTARIDGDSSGRANPKSTPSEMLRFLSRAAC